MSPRLKIILAIAGTLIIATGASATWYATHQQPQVPLFVDDAASTYTLTATASEQCSGSNKGAKIFVNEPCQVFLDADTAGEDPSLTVMWYEITNGKKLLIADQDPPFNYSFAVKSEDNGVHRFQAELIKDAAPAKVLAVSNVVEVEVKILTLGCSEARNSVAVISDLNLKKAIREAIARETNTPIAEEVDCALLRELKKLDASRRNIHSLAGLEHAIGLEELNLSENAIGGFAPIGVLKNLTNLNLNNTGLVDVAFLGGLEKLKELYLGDNSVKNIDALSRLNALTVLSVGKNSLSSLAPLQRMGNLGAGALITVVRNPLNWTADSEARKVVAALKQKAVSVDFDDLAVTLTGRPIGGAASPNITVKEGTNVELTAKPSLKNTVPEAQISKVELFENGKFVIELKAPTYKHVVRVGVGTFEYKVKVSTNDGAFAESGKVVVVGQKKNDSTPTPTPTPPSEQDPTPVPPVVAPVSEACLTPYVYCDPGNAEKNIPATCVFGLENPSCGIPIVVCDQNGCHKDDAAQTPFRFDGCGDLKNFMSVGSNKDVSGSAVPLPANKMCGGENFCKRILLCAK